MGKIRPLERPSIYEDPLKSKTMSQPRKKRVIVFEVRVTVFTDKIQEFLTSSIHACIAGLARYEMNQGRVTTFEIKTRVLDGKTFAPFKK